MNYQSHELSKLFPKMTEEEFAELKSDIKENGLLEPIALFENQILDGFHRYKACIELGIEGKFVNYKGDDPINFVVSKNLYRRQLTQSQKAALAVSIKEAWELRNPHGGDRKSESRAQKYALGKNAGIAGKQVGASQSYVEEATRIKKEDPEAFEKVKSGELTISEVQQENKRQKAKELIETLKTQGVKLPEGKYASLVIDPPWPMQKIERDVRPNQVEFDYPTMSEDELKKFGTIINQLSDDNAHLYLWTTHKFLPMALRLVENWGFNYQCLMTWVKNVGFTPFSWMYSTEHILFCTKGSLPLLKKGERLDFNAKVREHSRKPEIFYDLVCKVSPAPRIDMFGREAHKGFDVWGNEVKKYG